MSSFRRVHLFSYGTPAVGVTLPGSMVLEGGDFVLRSKMVDLMLMHGSREIGDRKIEARKIKVIGALYGEDVTLAQYQTAIGEIHSLLLYQDVRLEVVDDSLGSADRYINVGMIGKVKEDFEDGAEGRLAKVEIELNCPDPFWYLAAGSTVSAVVGMTVSFTGINNSGNVETYPVIEIEGTTATSAFTITNATNGDAIAINLGLPSAGTYTVDGEDGTVDFEDVSYLSSISSGIFPSLSPGLNNVQVVFDSAVAATTTVTVSWKNRTTVGP